MLNQSFLEYYRKIISINTTSSDNINDDKSNNELVEFLIENLSQKGFLCKKIAIPNNPTKFNLIAKYGKGNGGVAFSGHTDTVPANTNLWNTNPYELIDKNNRLYGLGTIDMKGFFAFLLHTIDSIDLKTLNKPIYIFATADEETSMIGASELVKFIQEHNKARDNLFGEITPDLIVIGEPTSMVPVIMHKGHLVQKITVRGKSGHSSDPNKGINAIKIMNKIVCGLVNFEENLKDKYNNPLFTISYPTLNIGLIKGGDVPNRICDLCILEFDIRPIPGLSIKSLIEQTYEVIKNSAKEHIDNVSIELPYPAAEPFDGHLDDSLLNKIESITDHKSIAVNYATEATYLQALAPTVVLGPGQIDLAHQPNEYISKAEIEPALVTIRKLFELSR